MVANKTIIGFELIKLKYIIQPSAPNIKRFEGMIYLSLLKVFFLTYMLYAIQSLCPGKRTVKTTLKSPKLP